MKKFIKSNLSAPFGQKEDGSSASDSSFTIAFPQYQRKKIYNVKKAHLALDLNTGLAISEPIPSPTVSELSSVSKSGNTTFNSTLNKSVDNDLIKDGSTSRKFEYSTFDACNQTAAIPMHYSTINKSVDILDTAKSPTNMRNLDFSAVDPIAYAPKRKTKSYSPKKVVPMHKSSTLPSPVKSHFITDGATTSPPFSIKNPKLTFNINKLNNSLNINTEMTSNNCRSCAETRPIRINVGGKIYISSYETLNTFPNTRFATLFNSDIQIVDENLLNQHFFIDRDCKMFRHILNFLRTKQLLLPYAFNEIDLLYAEAKYFLIQPMMVEIQAYKRRLRFSQAEPTFV